MRTAPPLLPILWSDLGAVTQLFRTCSLHPKGGEDIPLSLLTLQGIFENQRDTKGPPKPEAVLALPPLRNFPLGP